MKHRNRPVPVHSIPIEKPEWRPEWNWQVWSEYTCFANVHVAVLVSIVTKPWLWFGKGCYNSKARYASVSKLSESYNDLHYITLAWLTCLPTCLHDCMVTLFIAYYYMITFGCLRGKEWYASNSAEMAPKIPFFLVGASSIVFL
jgi:hypothetical protein